jgi:outer membrane murein-binding lipoprotein Lpp
MEIIMEKIKSPNRLLKTTLPVAALVAALALAGCATEQVAGTPKTNSTAEDILELGGAVTIHPGDSALVTPVIDDAKINRITNRIDEIDHQYPHGLYDDKAPTISNMPIRVDTFVALSGKSPQLDNDLACDTLNIDTHAVETGAQHLTAIALSDSADDQVLVSWPKESPDRAFVCFPEGNELTDGLVLVLDDIAR